MYKKKMACLMVLAIGMGSSLAANADTKTPKKGELCSGYGNTYGCPTLGNVTIEKIYESGYRVVGVIQITGGTVKLIIEQQ